VGNGGRGDSGFLGGHKPLRGVCGWQGGNPLKKVRYARSVCRRMDSTGGTHLENVQKSFRKRLAKTRTGKLLKKGVREENLGNESKSEQSESVNGQKLSED